MRSYTYRKTLASALTLGIALALSGCGGMASNPSLESVHQPVVTQTNYTLDVATGPGGISIPEQRRLSGWFEAMDLHYGDRISIDDPSRNPANRSAVEAVAGRYSMLVNDEAPVTPGYVNAGSVRVVVTRTTASVPGCPDWSAKSETNLRNATSTNYGCATNSNIAAMVADPSHLIQGASGSGRTTVMSGTKAIDSYRNRPPTGDQGLKEQSSKGN
ncbi:CpaD family pilus assembly protein [Novosphingobium sp.]|uniref:CpaD family pilus assembly protein n=1 Tax=Novosphingobium sp. TaxID=1874826 RepID=UPI00286A3DC3|nr:CpaD family pilus assembly protein [Novosphingobium sp.]